MNIVYWVRGATFANLALQSAVTFRVVYPDSRLFFYADPAAVAVLAPEVEDLGEVIVFDWNPQHADMVANVMAQADFCLSPWFDRQTLFVDADVIAGKKPVSLPGVDRCDVLLTARTYTKKDAQGNKIVGVADDMPYNYGVIFANPTREAKELFVWLRERVAKMSPQLQAWYGNQVALREFAGHRPDNLPNQRTKSVPWADIRLIILDAEHYNYTPESDAEDLTDKFLIHFKGDRKDLMQATLQEYL